MTESENKAIISEKKWVKYLITIPVFILVFFAMLVTVIQIPAVQTRIINYLTKVITTRTNYNMDVGYANLMWYDNILIENIKIYDKQDSVLLTTDAVKADIGFYELIVNNRLVIDVLELDRPSVRLIKKNDSTALNVSEFLGQLKGPPKKKKKSTPLSIGSIKVYEGHVSYNDMTKEVITEGKDHSHFGYRSIYTQLDDFSQHNDTIDFNFVYLQAIDVDKHMDIKSLNGLFQYCNKSMTLSNLDLRTHYSLIKDSIRFDYPSPNALKYFMDSVKFYVNLDSSFISSDDIALFAPSIDHLNQVYEVTGQIHGTVGHLMAQNMDLRFGKKTFIDGNLGLFGLPNIKETFIDFSCNKAILEPTDLEVYLPKEARGKVHNLGAIHFKGDYLGFPTDFVANGSFDMDVGKISSDINFKIGKNNTAFYSGNLKLEHFDIGGIVESDNFRNIYLDGHVRGNGLKIENANFHLNADIDSVEINKYTYSNIHANGDLAQGYFEGELKSKDPNFIFDGIVNIDVRDNVDKVNVSACLDALNLKPLGLSEDEIFIASHINLDLKGFHIDSLKGFANLHNSRLIIEEDELQLDSIKFLSFIIGDERIISLETDGLTAEAKGNFRNSTVLKEAQKLYQELKLSVINNADSLENYYNNREVLVENFEVDLKVNMWNANRFIGPFLPQVSLSKNILLEGKFISDETSILTMNTHLDTIQVGTNSFYNNLAELNISKQRSDRNILSSLYLSSNEQSWDGKSRTDNIFLETIWSNKVMDIEFNLDQNHLENNLDIKARLNFLEDSISGHFLNSEITALGNAWNFDPNNIIIYTGDKLLFENVNLLHRDQSIAVNGTWSDYQKDQIQIDIRNFGVDNLNSILPTNISGVIDGNIDMNKLKNDVLVESNLRAKSFYIDKFLVGDIDCFSDWENHRDRLYLEFVVNRTGKRIIDVNGHFYPGLTENELDMTADFDSANLNIIQPFVVDNFENLSGYASGKFKISGNPSSPILEGRGKLNDGTITVNYTKTTYSYEGGIVFEENHIGAENLKLTDAQNHNATFNGGMFHDGFDHFVLDITGNYDNFKLLNTGSKDNKLYYGTAYASGNISVLGAINNLHVTAHAKTNKGTRISIPVGELGEYNVEQKEYITFIDLNNPEHQKSLQDIAEEEIDLKGLKLDFDIEVTSDAYTELIFDAKAGDIIRGRGNGNIELMIDPYGDFNMFGDLQIESGGYNFTLYNIINKEFEIQKGSSISWYGDPYAAKLNINAKYRQLASLAPILNVSPDENSQELRRKYPSIVNLYLKGNLTSPEINFDINIEDYPDNITTAEGNIPLDPQVRAFKARLNANEQEMKRQVFSLVILRKFSAENSFQVSGSNTFGNSLSEFVSNQLSYWATQVDENLEVDVNLAGLDNDAFRTFQLRLSYSFLDGRLKLTRGGGFADQNNNSDISTILGDWTVEYLLTPDGRFRAKMYSRSNINASVNNQVGINDTETGFSLQFVRSFDELKHILIENRNENQDRNNPSQEPLDEKAQGVKEEEEIEPSSK